MLPAVSNVMKMRAHLLAAVPLLLLCELVFAAKPTSKQQAIARIESCLRRWDSSNRACSDLNANIDVLIGEYKKGDKSVLSEILKFSYLTNFFDDALLSDPNGFLSAVNALPSVRQDAIATGLAGEQFRTLPKERFLEIRSALAGIPSDSPNRSLADTCIKALDEHNVSLFVDYFPADTFSGRAAGFITDRYSRALYGFGERPLWRDSPIAEETWRFTYLGAWGGSRTVSLSVHTNGAGAVYFKWRAPGESGEPRTTGPIEVSKDQVNRFLETVREFEFWTAPTQVPSDGLDGAEWLLEGKNTDQYHIVTRWCPGIESKTPQTLAFARACRLLLEYAGHPIGPSC